MTASTWGKVQWALAIGAVILASALLWSRGLSQGLAPALAVLGVTVAVANWLHLRYGAVRQRRVALLGALLSTAAAVSALLRLALSWH